MALNYSSSSVCVHSKHPFLVHSKTKQNLPFNLCPNYTTPSANSLGKVLVGALSEKGADGRVTEDESRTSSASPSARAQLDRLEQLTSSPPSAGGYESDGNYGELTIREQLVQLVGERDDNFSIPLGKNIKKVTAKFLTISQKRNIRRQEYLDEVSQRNDVNFFATVGAFVLLPPLIILGIAIATGYVQLFP